MSIGLVGASFEKVSLQFLERIYLNRNQTQTFLKIFPKDVVTEVAVVSTCNRVEFYFVSDDFYKGYSCVLAAISDFLSISSVDLTHHMEVKRDQDVVEHLFRVASGVKSMVFGECEILGQVKQAYEISYQYQGTGPQLNKMIQTAISVGKRVRDETKIGQGIMLNYGGLKIILESGSGVL